MALNPYDDLLEQQAQEQGGTNPYQATLDMEDRNKQIAVRSSLTAAAETQPDRHADVMKLSERYKLAPDLVDRNYDTLKKKSEAEAIDPQKMMKNHRGLTEWLADPNNASIARDDLQNAEATSERINEFGLMESMYTALSSGAARMNSSLLKVPALAADAYYNYAANPLAEAMGYAPTKVPEVLRNNAATGFFDSESQALAEQVPDIQTDTLGEISKGNFAKAGRSLAVQFASNAPNQALTIALAAAGMPGAGLGLAGATTAADVNDRSQDAGLSPTNATNNAILQGSAEMLFERITTIPILKKWEAAITKQAGRDVSRKVLTDFAKTLAGSFGQEALGEAGTQVVQDTSDYVTGANPDLKLTDVARNAGNAGLIGGFSGAAMASPTGALMGSMRVREMNQAKRAMDFHIALGEEAQASKVRGRLPEAHQQMIANITKDGPVENVYMPVEAVETFFQSKNIDTLEAMQQLGLTELYSEAKETGDNIKVPLATFITKLVDTEYYQGLARDIKYSPEALTVNEAEANQKQLNLELKAYDAAAVADDVSDVATPEEARVASAVEVRRDIKRQLLEMNNPLIGPKEAEQYSLLHGQFALSMASRTGRDPQEIYAQYGLKIQTKDGMVEVGPQPESVMAAQGQVLNQSAAAPAPAMYSKVIKTVEDKMGGSASSQQILAMLKDTREEERKWLGLDDFVAGKEKVSKKDLLDHLRANQPEIVDITKGEPQFDKEAIRNAGISSTPDGSYAIYDRQENVLVDGLASYDDARAELDRLMRNDDETKYSQYKLPGGENYREVLFTLPPNGVADLTVEKDEAAWSRREARALSFGGQAPEPSFILQSKVEGSNNNTLTVRYYPERETEQYEPKIDDYDANKYLTKQKHESFAEAVTDMEQALNRHRQSYSEEARSKNYTSSHYDEKNILAHTRLDDRIDADGKKVLFIEEIQSDWHQDGRKKGYTDEALTARKAEVKKQVEALPLKNLFDYTNSREIQDAGGSVELADEFSRLFIGKDSNTVPNAPFKKTWHEYAMKRIVRMAVDGGYDRIAWTTGEQQAERFNLSKTVDEIRYYREGDSFGIEVTGLDGKTLTKEDGISESRLEAIVGKEVASKIVAGEGNQGTGVNDVFTILQGPALKVGGEGMKGFYDKILVDYANKLGKKFGAKVGETEIAAAAAGARFQAVTRTDDDGNDYHAIEDTEQSFDLDGEYSSASQALSTAMRMNDENRGGTKVHSLDITPQMKQAAIEQGFELFQSDARKGVAEGYPSAPIYGEFKAPPGVRSVGVTNLPREQATFADAKQAVLGTKESVVVKAMNGSSITINDRTFGKTESEIFGRNSERAKTLSPDEKLAAVLIAKNLPSLIPHIVLDAREANYKTNKKPGVTSYKRYYGQVSIDGVPYLFQLKSELNKKANGVAAYEGAYLEYARKLETPALSTEADSGEGLKIDQGLRDTTYQSPARADLTIGDFTQNINSVRVRDPLFQSDAADESPRGRIVIKSNRQMEIDLFRKKADLSTLLHETGHFYLEVLGDLSVDPNASQQLKDDYETVRQWMGLKQGEKIEVKHHEQWARAFELYLARGQAPPAELRGAFAHFKVWLLRIYKNLARLNVDLSDDVTAVMGRLIATDQQLSEAIREQRQPMFMDPAAAGMTEKEVAKYRTAMDDARRESEEELTAKVVKHEMRKREAAYKEARKEVQSEVEAEANQQRIYRALSILQRGKLPDGSELPPGVKAMKLDRESIVRAYGKDFLDRLPRPFVYAKEGGVDFNMAAEMLGYESGDAMLTEFANAPEKKAFVAAMTDERMEQMFPDEMRTAFPEELVKAVHADSRGKLLRMELQHLATNNLPVMKDMIRKIARRVPSEAEVRDQAASIVGKKKVGDIKPYQFQRAEVKAAREAGVLFTKGDIEGAFMAKRRELLNYELFRAATAALEQFEKAQELHKKIGKKDADIAKTRDIDLVNVARAILSQHGLGRSEKTAEQILQTMKSYDPENYESALAIIGNSGLNPAPYREISFDDFTAMNDTVKALWDLARQARSIEIDGVRMDREEIKAQLISRIDAIKDQNQKPGYDKAVSKWEKTKMELLGMRAALRRVEFWVDAADGDGAGGVFRKFIWNPISEATSKYRVEKIKVLTQWQDIVKEWAPNASTAPIQAPELGYTFANKAELLGAILHTGNKSNLEKLLLGRSWGSKLDDGTLDTTKWDSFLSKMWRDGVLTKADYDFAQKTWDLVESMKPQAQKAHKSMYGFYFNEITANDVDTPFGMYRGGYIPAITDQVMVEDSAIRQEQESIMKNNNSFMFPTTGRGFTKSRVEAYTAPLAIDLRLVGSHLDKVLRFIHIEPKVKEVGRLVMDKSFRSHLSELDPTIGAEMLVPWLQRAAQQTVSTPSKGWAGRGLDRFAKELRKRAGLQTMFFNVTNTLQQVTGFTIAAVKVKPKYLRNSIARYIKAPTDFGKMVSEKSQFMETRTATQVMEVNSIIDDITINPSKFDDFKSFVQQHGYFLQSAAQNFVDVNVWGGAYEQAIAQGLSEVEAVRSADSAVRETQGSMNPEDMSRFEGGSPFVRLFTMFYSYFNMQSNLLGTEFTKTVRDLGLRKGAGKLLYLYTMGFMLPALFSDILVKSMGNGLDEDDDEQYLDDLLATFFTSQFSTATAMFPGIGPAIKSTVNAFNDKPFDDKISVSPAVQLIESSVKASAGVYDAIANGNELKKGTVRDVLSIVGLLSGIPTGPIQRPVSYLMDVDSGAADPTGPIDYTRGLVTGKPGQIQ